MILAPQSAVINQSPASSEGEIAEGVSAASASPETIPSSEVDPLQMEPVAGAANFEIAPEELAATTSNVDSVSLDNISSSNETVAPSNPRLADPCRS